ncbi:MAG: MATE family efflux transporter [Pseudobdellovibrionaceae bacterium]|nr:MATE family efflux transporter [Bdellovibrionales bacterium]USN46419.1 MAG: MATE family efflux transporter [Pseudobdellovibrionaceae bacterium]
MQLVTLWHEYKKTIKLSLPLIVSNLSHVLYGIIDSVMVGSLGVVPLAASAFINGVIAIPTVFLVGLSSAFSVLVAQSLGRRAYSDCGSYLTNSFWFAQTLTVVILAGLFFMQPLLNHFGQAPDVVTAGMEYYLYMAVSLLFLTATAVFRKYSEGLSYTLAPTVFYTVGILLNVFFNWIFIFGHLGAPPMGLAGAGLGTLLARGSVAIGLGVYIYWANHFKETRLGLHLKYLNWQHLKNVASLAIPSGLQHLFEVSLFSISAIFVGWFGATALASHQIAINLATATFMIALGLSFGTSIRVGHALGQGRWDQIQHISWSSVIFTGVFMLAVGGLFWGLRFELPKIYIADPKVILLSAQLLVVAACFQFFDGAQAVLIGALKGISDIKWPTILTFLSYWGVGLPACYVFGVTLGWGSVGVWYGLALSLMASSTLLGIRLKRILSLQQSKANQY